MEVKKGYKQTEVGVIPDDWDCKPLDTYTSYISYGFTNPMPTTEAGIYMITARDIAGGSVKYTTARKTSVEAYQKLLTQKSRPKKNDVLLTKDGTLGRLALVGDEAICINQSVAILRPNDLIVPLFFKKLLEAPFYQDRMLEDAGGSTIKHIYITIVNKMPLGLPPTKAEQEAIADALSDADGLIESLEDLIAKKHLVKQGAMQELLTGKKRLPGFAKKKGYKQTEVGEIPEDWEPAKVRDFASIKTGPFGTLLKASEYSEKGGVPLISVGEIRKGFLQISEETPHVCERVTKRLPKYILKAGDIVFGRKGGVDRSSIIRDWQDGWFLGSDGISIRPKIHLDAEFVGLQFQSNRVTEWLLQNAIGTTMPSLNQSILQEAIIPIPPSKEEQAAIARVLTDIDVEITAVESKLAKARRIKEGMMQELLTGKTRLI